MTERSFCNKLLIFLCCFFTSLPIYAYQGYLQLGVFSQKANAQRMQAKLQTLTEHPSAIKRYQSKQAVRYTVIIGGFSLQKQAVSLKQTLAKLGYPSILKVFDKQHQLYRMMPHPAVSEAEVSTARQELKQAIDNPEYLMYHSLHLPTSPNLEQKKTIRLTLREAILLSLRYSADLQSTELDRILARYQLRIEQNTFELQYALSGNNMFNWAKTDGASAYNQNWQLSSSVSKKSRWGGTGTATLNQVIGTGFKYSPQLVLDFEQPLLRGAGPSVVEQGLNDRLDTEIINKLSLKQSYIDKVVSVITAYRGLIRQKNTYQTQQESLKEAKYTYWVNKKRIEAGELEKTGNIQQEYQVANLSVTLESQKNGLMQSKRSFLQLIGLDPTLPIEVPNDVTLAASLKAPDVQSSINYALSHNTAYLNALIQYRITKRAYVAAQNQQLWQLNLRASQTYGSAAVFPFANGGFSNISNGRNQTSSVGLNLSVPVNDLNRNSSLISAKVSLEKQRLLLLAQKRQVETEVINKIIAIQTNINLYKMSLKQLELAERSYNIEIQKRKVGIASSLDVTNTQNQLINAKNSVIGSKIAYLEGMSALEQFLGTTLDVWKIKVRIA